MPAESGSSFGLEKLLRIGGASFVILASIFFVSTAINRGWIGPTAQLVLSTVVSAALIAVSFRIPKDRKPWRASIAIAGASAWLSTGVVGYAGLDILSANAALAWLALSTAGFVGLGRAHDAESVAVAGAPAALLGAGLMGAFGASAAVVVAATTLFGLSVLAATWNRGWFATRCTGAATLADVAGGVALAETVNSTLTIALPVSAATVLALGASQLFEWINTQNSADQKPSVAALIEARFAAVLTPWVTAVVSIALAGSAAAAVENSTTTGWFAVVVGAVVAGSFEFARRHASSLMFTLHQVAGLAVVLSGSVLLLDGPVLMAAVLGQTLVAVVLAARTRLPEALLAAGLLGLVSILWNSITILLSLIERPMTLAQAVVTGVFVVLCAGCAWFLRGDEKLSKVWYGSWGIYLVWVAAALQGAPQHQMLVSLAWASSALALIAARSLLSKQMPGLTVAAALNVGLATLGLTALKLIFVDLVAVDVLWRAALFFAVGGVFLRLGFILPKLRGEEPRRSVAQGPGSES